MAAATETTAEPLDPLKEGTQHEHMTHRLHGVKWFTSATDSSMALALARERGEDGKLIPGNKGLAMFYLEVRAVNRLLTVVVIV